MALEPSFAEMESTCRELRRKNKFMPSISEAIEELEEQKKLWDRRSEVVWFLEEWHEELPQQIASAKVAEQALAERQAKAEEAKKAAAERMAAKSQPIVAGDRVRNTKYFGNVVAVGQFDSGATRYRVRVDGLTQEYDFWLAQLERLIPGDEGFEPPAVPMIEHRQDAPMTPTSLPAEPLDASGDKVGVPVDRSSETRNGEDD